VNVAANAAYSFTNIALQTGDVVTVRAQASGKCISAAATVTTTCFTTAPKITTDVQGYLATGTTTISGTSAEAAGTTIRVYASPATLLATTTVQAGGSWSATVAALTGGTNYYATSQNGSCSVSASSATATARTATTVCPTITGTYAEGATTVSGTLPSAFTGTVYLYQDDAQIGSVAVTAALNWTITVSVSTPLYSGGVLTVGAQATSGTLNKSCGSTTTVSCSLPGTPVVSPLSSTISSGQSVTFSVTGAESGVLYSVLNTSSGLSYAASVFGSGADQPIITNVFTTPGVYNISIVADKLSGGCLSNTAAVITVNGTLPVTWRSFTVIKQPNGAMLYWVTSSETNTAEFEVQYSRDGIRWNRIGAVPASGNTTGEINYQFLHPAPVDGMNYYRLLQKDADGNTKYSSVISLSIGNNDQLLIYPNPATGGKLNIRIAAAAQLSVYTIEGRLVHQQPLMSGVQEINISRLPKGFYHLRIGDHHEQLIVQ
jgi:Secretion system C-terminal sorting domain